MLNNLKAIIDKDKLGSYKGTVSLPFRSSGDPSSMRGESIAVKVVDEAGRETMRILELD